MDKSLEIVAGEKLPVITQQPVDVIKNAQVAADALMEIVRKKGLAKKLGGKKEHLEFEAWATVASFYNSTIRGRDVEPVGEPNEKNMYFGFKAHAEIVNSDGDIIGGAEAYCMRDEPNWKTKPNFQLASMAQTRAGSKAARMVFSRVVVLAGFSPTPAEEMEGVFTEEKKTKQQPAKAPDKDEEVERIDTVAKIIKNATTVVEQLCDSNTSAADKNTKHAEIITEWTTYGDLPAATGNAGLMKFTIKRLRTTYGKSKTAVGNLGALVDEKFKEVVGKEVKDMQKDLDLPF